MPYEKKGGWGGDRRSNNGRKKGSHYKVANHITMMYDLHFKDRPWRHSYRPQVYRSHPVCPVCDNEDGEKITELRERFFQCEKCKHCWDTELSR